MLSVLWVVVGGFWGLKLVMDPIWKDYFACSADIATTHENCSAYLSQRLADADTYKWKVAALTGLAPIPIAWLLVYGLIGLVRWIRQGFKAT
ncbi:MAG TPA: hypothetical protein DCL72_07185 [Rhizobiales bacterium]|nr:hypothetical protein [Hyphomicrobiales bacterium]HAN62646.1 hypothetical protein [Hyphomicrobiales bacterium]